MRNGASYHGRAVPVSWITDVDALQSIADFWGAQRYSQHAICLTNDALLIWIYTASDLLIFVSYFALSAMLWFSRSKGISPKPVAFTLFASFILACGLTHLTKTMTLFTGVYRLDVLVVVATAIISAFTAIFTLKGIIDARS